MIIYTYAFFIRVLVTGRIYTYTGSVVQHWWSCTPSQSFGVFLGSARFLCWMPLVGFFGFTNCVLLYDNETNTRMLVPFGIRFRQHFTLGYLRSVISHLPGCFFFTLDLLSECRIQHGIIGLLYVTSRYSTRFFYRGFKSLQLVVFAAFSVVD